MSEVKETGLTTKDSATKMVEAIDVQLAKLKAIEQTPWKAGQTLDCGGQSINIRTETKLDNLVKALSSVMGREVMYNEAVKFAQAEIKQAGGELKDFPPFTIDGHPADAIKSDIVLRMRISTQEETRSKLEKLRARANEFMTVEDKKAAFLAELAAFGGVEK